MTEENGSWIYCESCGKKLLKRLPNGVFVLKFGKNSNNQSVIDLKIFGSIEMKCFREECRHSNIITLFPSQ